MIRVCGLTSSSSMAASLLPRFSATIKLVRCVACPSLPPRLSVQSLRSASSVSFSGSQRLSPLQVKATSDEKSVNDGELFTDLKEKWDVVENKPTVLLYGGGAIVAVWLSSVIVHAINSIPLLPEIMELVGLGCTGWFAYRYLLFQSSRKELTEDVELLKKKIAGSE